MFLRIALTALALLAPLPAPAAEACTLVLSARTGETFHKSGPDCATRFSPASTFKLPLALMGFEAGILTGPEAPAIAYDPAINARYPAWRQTTTPRHWLKNSVIWYSQWLTRQAGPEAFRTFVDGIGYGNRDLSGDPGKDNGLTHAWLSSSLSISPEEQAAFLIRLVNRDLGLAPETYELLDRTVQRFPTEDGSLSLSAKTGTAWATDAAGNRLKGQHGWFVGWVDHGGDRLVFVRLQTEADPGKGFASSRTRAQVLRHLPEWIAQ